jgi:hypothetical protein
VLTWALLVAAGCGARPVTAGAQRGPDAAVDAAPRADASFPRDAPLRADRTVWIDSAPWPDLGPPDAASRCRSNSECPATHFCALGGCRPPGVCQARPVSCDDVYAPVCGCDGRTYPSSCNALAIGVSVAREGHCDVKHQCEELSRTYRELLQLAKACTPDTDELQCTQRVESIIGCTGCPTYVESTGAPAQLAHLRQQWNAVRCFEPLPCLADIGCRRLNGAVCTTQGICEDRFP